MEKWHWALLEVVQIVEVVSSSVADMLHSHVPLQVHLYPLFF